jgi:hypothetical protein
MYEPPSLLKDGFAEVMIPFTTLQFRRDSIHYWAINFQRDIQSKKETALWQGWSRDYSVTAFSHAGTMSGLTNIAYSRRFELKTYGLAGWEYHDENGSSFKAKAGGDLNVNITPTLKLNLTVNTDFAQVEADRIPVNLSRFDVFYPEKREFFLEGFDQFRFYLGNNNELFYTRTIGLENLQTVPIIAGVRLFGKAGKNDLGFLNIQEGSADSIPSANNTVFRYKRDVGSQSYIGGIITNQFDGKTSNQVLGIDGSYFTSAFLKDHNLEVHALIAQSWDDLSYKNNSTAFRFYIDYPNDFAPIISLPSQASLKIFILHSDFYNVTTMMHLTGIVYHSENFSETRCATNDFCPLGSLCLSYAKHGEFESFYDQTIPLGAEFKSGESFEITWEPSYDRLDEPFDLTDTISISPGEYWMSQYGFQFSSFQARRIWGSFTTIKAPTIQVKFGLQKSQQDLRLASIST